MYRNERQLCFAFIVALLIVATLALAVGPQPSSMQWETGSRNLVGRNP